MKLYKYRKFGEVTDNIIQNSSLYFAPPISFNDPFDCNLEFENPRTKEQISEIIINTNNLSNKKTDQMKMEQIIARFMDSPKEFSALMKENLNDRVQSKIGVLSLSKIPDNILMWSHYAASHTGLIFEFDISQNSPCFVNIPGTPPTLALPVEYVTKYQPLKYGNSDDTYKLLLTKHIGWEYEKEYRVIDMNQQGEKKFDKSDLISIIFGLHAKQSDIDHIIDLCKKKGYEHLIFKKAKIIPSTFLLTFEEINMSV